MKYGAGDILPHLKRWGLPFAKRTVGSRSIACAKHKRASPVCPTVFGYAFTSRIPSFFDVDCRLYISAMVRTAFGTIPFPNTKSFQDFCNHKHYKFDYWHHFNKLFPLFIELVLQECYNPNRCHSRTYRSGCAMAFISSNTPARHWLSALLCKNALIRYLLMHFGYFDTLFIT